LICVVVLSPDLHATFLKVDVINSELGKIDVIVEVEKVVRTMFWVFGACVGLLYHSSFFKKKLFLVHRVEVLEG
jgi:hypothetical protein